MAFGEEISDRAEANPPCHLLSPGASSKDLNGTLIGMSTGCFLGYSEIPVKDT